MTEKKAKVISIIIGIFFYIALSFLAISNNPFSAISNDYFLGPLLAIIASLLVVSISRKKENNPTVSIIFLGAYILLQLILGFYALISVLLRKEAYTEIDWIMYVIAFSIGLNGWELFLRKFQKKLNGDVS